MLFLDMLSGLRRGETGWAEVGRLRFTFRHTFSSILKGNGEDVKVVQELLRHSTSRMTLDTYTQALGPDKRAAQSKVVGMIRPKERVFSVYRDTDGVSV
jgi:integrase